MKKTQHLGKSSMRAGMDPKTGRKYLRAGRLPSEMKSPHDWRTRKDPFEEHWPLLEQMLEHLPGLEPKTLMEYLLEHHPDQYHEGQLRTLQRRVRSWRATNGPEKEVFFPQEHRPGEAMQLDFTDMAPLGFTVQQEQFSFLLCHIVLPFSNWEWGAICFSESFEALKKGIKAALNHLGFTTKWLQTDNSTAATHKIGSERDKGQPENAGVRQIPRGRAFNEAYAALVRGLGMEPRTTDIGAKEQNGDVESAHGKLKKRLRQALLLRGGNDFDSPQEVEAFIQEVMHKANAGRSKRFVEELRHLRKLDRVCIVEYTEQTVKVTRNATISVKRNLYTVPSRLIGETVRVRVYEDRLEIFYHGKRQLVADRMRGEHRHNINYRHLVDSLSRKPGALARYRYLSELHPSLVFQRAYEALSVFLTERQASTHYIQILKLCKDQMEAEVATALQVLLEEGEVPTIELVNALVGTHTPTIPDMAPMTPDLAIYDRLLEGYEAPQTVEVRHV